MKTKPTILPQTLNKTIDSLLTQQKITLEDIEGLSNPDRRRLANKATKILSKLTGIARDNFLEKIEQVMPGSAKNEIWEYNHSVITTFISNYIHEYEVMPGKSVIAEETGLSRPTIDKHLIAYRQHPEFIAEMEQFKLMSNEILVSVFKYASKGNMRAAKLYFEMVGTLNKQPAGTIVNEQTNYIQINNTILSQEKLKQLSAAQLTLIENIVTNKEYITLPETVPSQMLGR